MKTQITILFFLILLVSVGGSKELPSPEKLRLIHLIEEIGVRFEKEPWQVSNADLLGWIALLEEIETTDKTAHESYLKHAEAGIGTLLTLNLNYEMMSDLRTKRFQGAHVLRAVGTALGECLIFSTLRDELGLKAANLEDVKMQVSHMMKKDGYTPAVKSLMFPFRKALLAEYRSKPTQADTGSDEWSKAVGLFCRSIGL